MEINIMKKGLFGLLLTSSILLAACTTDTNGYSLFDTPKNGNYNRSDVCANLTRQIQFNQDQGYNTTNQGVGQIQQQQILAAYRANGCDK